MNACNEIKKGLPTPNHRYKNINYMTCVCNFYDPSVQTLIDMEEYYEKHGISDLILMNQDQNTYILKKEVSAKLMQYFKIIKNFKLEKQLIEQKKQEAEARNKARVR